MDFACQLYPKHYKNVQSLRKHETNKHNRQPLYKRNESKDSDVNVSISSGESNDMALAVGNSTKMETTMCDEVEATCYSVLGIGVDLSPEIRNVRKKIMVEMLLNDTRVLGNIDVLVDNYKTILKSR